ncbi:MAG: hypothetical protein WDM77_20335 [Steroidobacteraceae bacterium]
MLVTVDPKIRCRAGHAIAQRTPEPSLIIVAGFGKYRPDGEGRGGVQRGKRTAARAPGVRVTRFIRALTPAAYLNASAVRELKPAASSMV